MCEFPTADRRPGAARLKICVAAVLQRISGMAPPRQRTNAGRLFCSWTRKQADLRRRRIFVAEISYVLVLTFYVIIFSQKSEKFLGNYFE